MPLCQSGIRITCDRRDSNAHAPFGYRYLGPAGLPNSPTIARGWLRDTDSNRNKPGNNRLSYQIERSRIGRSGSFGELRQTPKRGLRENRTLHTVRAKHCRRPWYMAARGFSQWSMEDGADGRCRSGDLLRFKQALFQLSYNRMMEEPPRFEIGDAGSICASATRRNKPHSATAPRKTIRRRSLRMRARLTRSSSSVREQGLVAAAIATRRRNLAPDRK